MLYIWSLIGMESVRRSMKLPLFSMIYVTTYETYVDGDITWADSIIYIVFKMTK